MSVVHPSIKASPVEDMAAGDELSNLLVLLHGFKADRAFLHKLAAVPAAEEEVIAVEEYGDFELDGGGGDLDWNGDEGRASAV